MEKDSNRGRSIPATLDVVALLADRPADNLARGQVGTVVEAPGGEALLVEFSDDDGRAYALVPCLKSDLIVLHYVPQAA
jgi:hypothetical protein